VVIPTNPGVFSALGMQTLDIVHEFSRTRISMVSETTSAEVAAVFEGLNEEAVEVLRREQVDDGSIQLLGSVEMRYDGQEHTISVPAGTVDPSLEALSDAFENLHDSSFGFRVEGEVEIVGYGVRAIGILPKPKIGGGSPGSQDASAALTGHRHVHDRFSGEAEWPVYRRDLLEPGNRIDGPAIIEELTATTVVSPDFEAGVDSIGNLVLDAVERTEND
jgi:N-methylhydantoinase A